MCIRDSQKAYRHSDLFRPKVEALADVLFEYGAEKVLLRQRRFTADDVIEGSIIIGAVDSMSSRRAIWAAVQASPEVELYLDGRLDSEVAQICAVDPLDANWYESRWLFSDEEASQTGNCTMRVIVYPATVMAGVMCRHLSRWYQGEPITQFVQFDCTNLELMKLGDIEELMNRGLCGLTSSQSPLDRPRITIVVLMSCRQRIGHSFLSRPGTLQVLCLVCSPIAAKRCKQCGGR